MFTNKYTIKGTWRAAKHECRFLISLSNAKGVAEHKITCYHPRETIRTMFWELWLWLLWVDGESIDDEGQIDCDYTVNSKSVNLLVYSWLYGSSVSAACELG